MPNNHVRSHLDVPFQKNTYDDPSGSHHAALASNTQVIQVEQL